MFFGYLKVFGLYVIYLGASFAVKDNLFAATMLGFVLIAAVIMLSPFAMWGVHAYRATRSKYRNIAFQIDRSRRKEFIGGIIYRSILCVVTLYLYVPFFFHYVNKYLIESTSFGDLKLRYTGDGTEYFQLIMRNILFCILTLGLYIPWAIVGNMRYRLNHIEIDGAKIKTTIAGGDVLVIALMQIILVPLTLGLAFPYVQVFALKTFFNNMSLEGSLDFAAIQAGTGNGSNALGDTVADFFDVDVL